MSGDTPTVGEAEECLRDYVGHGGGAYVVHAGVVLGELARLRAEARENAQEVTGLLSNAAAVKIQHDARVERLTAEVERLAKALAWEESESRGLRKQRREMIEEHVSELERITRERDEKAERCVVFESAAANLRMVVSADGGGIPCHSPGGGDCPPEGWHFIFGGPYTSYTMPEPDEDGGLCWWVYDEDEGAWTESQALGARIINDEEFGDLTERAETAERERGELLAWAEEMGCEMQADDRGGYTPDECSPHHSGRCWPCEAKVRAKAHGGAPTGATPSEPARGGDEVDETGKSSEDQ